VSSKQGAASSLWDSAVLLLTAYCLRQNCFVR
jgi:hypothetical protein